MNRIVIKKIVSAVLIFVCVLSGMHSSVSAAGEEKLPFQLVAPAYVTAEWLETNDSPTTTKITYSLSNEMTDFFKQLENAHLDDNYEEFMSKYGIDEISMTTQVDWAVDDVNDPVSGWHSNEFWKGVPEAGMGFGYDSEGCCRVGEWDIVDGWIGNGTETVNDHWVTRYVSEDAFNGNPDEGRPGLKDQLNPDQYEYRYEDGDGNLYIDYEKHTVYFRMRFVVTTTKWTDDEMIVRNYYSDWSNIASVGKDAEKFEPLTKADLPAPEITGLRMTDHDFNDNPVVAFTLTVPDALAKNATELEAHGGGIVIEVEGRVKGDPEFVGLQGDWIIKAGEMEAALFSLVNDDRPTVPKDAEVELRCRYCMRQPDQDDIYSDWSKVITFGTEDITQGANETIEEKTEKDEETKPANPETPAEKKCPICHFCPQPLGLCIFIWLLIILLIVAVIVVVVVISRKKKKDGKK